jgi:flagellar protein FlaI
VAHDNEDSDDDGDDELESYRIGADDDGGSEESDATDETSEGVDASDGDATDEGEEGEDIEAYSIGDDAADETSEGAADGASEGGASDDGSDEPLDESAPDEASEEAATDDAAEPAVEPETDGESEGAEEPETVDVPGDDASGAPTDVSDDEAGDEAVEADAEPEPPSDGMDDTLSDRDARDLLDEVDGATGDDDGAMADASDLMDELDDTGDGGDHLTDEFDEELGTAGDGETSGTDVDDALETGSGDAAEASGNGDALATEDGAEEGVTDDDLEYDVDVDEGAGDGDGGGGVLGGGGGSGELEAVAEIEGFEEAVEEAEDITSFFSERESTEGSVLDEVGEVGDFFEPGAELENEFGENELNTLLSEAKQGVADFEGMEGYVEHERYWVNKPYAYIAILYSDAENDYMYYVVEPSLDEYEEAVRRDLEERLRDKLMYEDISDEMDEEEVLEQKAMEIIDDYGIEVDEDSMHKILYYLVRDYVHDGKIDPIMRDPHIEDVSCDGDNVPIFVYHSEYRDLMSNIEFEKEELDSFVIKLAQKSGKHISVADPLVDASTPDGSRVQMTLGEEVTSRGSTFTIRKFNEVPFTPIDLIGFNTFSLEQMAYLWTCIENNKSLIFAGGTASGKTTSMNAVTLFIPPKSKVISIEDTREVTLPHMNWIPSVTRDSFGDEGSGEVDEYELLRAALRQRPEYLVVGEVRGEEALTLFQAMSTGHTTYSTMHADSVDSAIHRLENPPISVPRSMLKALDIVSIQTQTFVGGERVRRNVKLVEIIGIDPKTRNIRTDDIFQWDAESDEFIKTGNSTALQDIKRARGWSDEELERQIDMRREVLQYLVENDIDGYEDVSKTIQAFIIDPDRILNQIREDRLDLEQLEELETLNL